MNNINLENIKVYDFDKYVLKREEMVSTNAEYEQQFGLDEPQLHSYAARCIIIVEFYIA